MPEWVSFSKLRGAYSIVGNGVPPFITYPVSYVTAGGEILASDAAPFAEMKPEMTHSVENRCPLPTAIGLCNGTDWL